MPANVVLFNSAVEVNEREEEETAAASSTCSVADTTEVNEPASEQIQNGELLAHEEKLQPKPEEEKKGLVDGKCALAWQKQLKSQEKLIHALQQEKEKQLLSIATHLMVMEAELRKEQSKIMNLLHDKDKTIVCQEEQIRALLVLNRKLSSAIDKHRHCSQCKCNIKAAFRKSRHYSSDPTEALKQIRSSSQICRSVSDTNSEKYENKNLIRNLGSIHLAKSDDTRTSAITQSHCIDEFQNGNELNEDDNCSGKTSDEGDMNLEDADPNAVSSEADWTNLLAIEEAVKNYDCDNDTNYSFPLQNFKHLHTLEDLDETEELDYLQLKEGNREEGFHLESHQASPETEKNLQLSACYNRVMSNHRNVTKPKDVKYKKINRVKSRSLEELRGKLRNWTHPFFLSEKST